MARALSPRRREADGLLLAALYLLEFCVLLLALDLPRLLGRPLRSAIGSVVGLYALLGVLGIVIALLLIVRQYGRARREGVKPFAVTLTLNVLSMVLMVAAGEIVTRVLTVQTPEGAQLIGTLLLPRDWGFEVARNRALLDRTRLEEPYLVSDELLGWTVGPARRSHDGLNQSSVEGIRSDRAGVSFAATHPARRVALVGDSFTFGLDVRYEDSWASRLEQVLRPGTQVLNFGVSGYGIDQAYLRYTRDVRPWHARVVIFGVFPGDLGRSMGVYPLIYLPGEDLPFAKPRFILKDGGLSLVNVPVPTMDTVLSTRSVSGLPYVDYDMDYHESDWRWRPFHASQLVRAVLSRYPVRSARGPAVSPEALRAVNGELLRDFVRLVRADGSMPLVVYMPGRNDYLAWAQDPKHLPIITRDVLRQVGVEFTDLTPCVGAVPEAERFVAGKRHYSPRTSAAIASCLKDLVSSRL
ncbi:MAG TPA: hypothetical protein VJX71_18930 [Methylomirabilota bacterium]|nr:hypothetical protein [Methylomirabilota bacterium]